MRKTAIRTYEVRRDDFPIGIEVVAKHLPRCQAVASRIQVRKDTEVSESFSVEVTEDPAKGAIRYSIPVPAIEPKLDLIQIVDCTFPDDAPDSSAYEVTISSARGDRERTTGSRPTISPRTILLTFQYR
jgi:hypothetical protein